MTLCVYDCKAGQMVTIALSHCPSPFPQHTHTSPQGLETLCRLRNLNLAGNQITTVGQALEGFSELEVLDLSGNKLSALQVSLLSVLH